jgi:hypothetical protein
MGFDENSFMIAGTAIAIAGVGLYIWDTRKESIQSATYSGYNALTQPRMGGSKTKRRHNIHRKTMKH